MSAPRNDQKTEGNGSDAPATEQTPDRPVYMYASAGVTERTGGVPVWLWLVAISLLIWGIYYLVTYWNAPAGPVG